MRVRAFMGVRAAERARVQGVVHVHGRARAWVCVRAWACVCARGHVRAWVCFVHERACVQGRACVREHGSARVQLQIPSPTPLKGDCE